MTRWAVRPTRSSWPAGRRWPTCWTTPTVEPGEIDVRARIDDRVLIVTIADRGSWQALEEQAGRGRGLRLIQALVDGLDLRSTDDGTVMTLTWPFPVRRSA